MRTRISSYILSLVWFNNQSSKFSFNKLCIYTYWLCFSYALFTKNNYHSQIFSLISNSKCEVIDPNFDLHPISGSSLIIFSHYSLLFFWCYSVYRDYFLYCCLQLSNGFDVHLHVKHARDVPDLKGQRWGLHSQTRLMMKCSCAFMCITGTQYPKDQAVNCRFSLWLQDPHRGVLELTISSDCLLG